MKIFMTGGGGYLGSHLVKTMRDRGWKVTTPSSSEADLRNPDALNKFTEKFDQIWHLAAWTQAGEFCLHHSGEQWLINQQINTTILGWWHKEQSQAKLVSIGTSCSYAPGVKLSEENYLEGEPIESLYVYGMTKRMLLIGLRSLGKQFGLRHLTLVPSTLFGPGYHTEGKQLHFIFDLIRKILHGKISGERVVLWGDGHQKRELVFIDDFVSVGLELAGYCENDLVNIGSGREFSIRWYAEEISREIGYNPEKIEYDTSRYVGVRSKQLSIAKLRQLKPDFEPTPIDVALKRTVRWYAGALRKDLFP